MPKTRRLATQVHLINPETSQRVVLGPDDEVPAWAAEMITNPDVWESDSPAEPEEQAAAPKEVPTTKTALYALGKEELVQLNEERGIEASMDDTKAVLVENLLAR